MDQIVERFQQEFLRKDNSSSIIDDFSLGMRALEDLQLLAGPSVLPLIERASFHFSKAFATEKSLNEITGRNSNIGSLLEKGPIQLLEELLLESNLKELHFLTQFEQFTLSDWNRFIRIFPIMAGLIEILCVDGGNCFLEIDKESMRVSLTLDENADYLSKRKEIYAATKSLLKLHVWSTFDVQEEGSGSRLELNFDYSHKEDAFYLVEVGAGKALLFSASIVNYLIPREKQKDFLASSDCPCIVIKPSGDVQLRNRGSAEIINETFDGEVVHFPFLFRPVSLVIPKQGNVSSLFQLLQRESLVNGRDYSSGSSYIKQNFYIDLFSMMVK